MLRVLTVVDESRAREARLAGFFVTPEEQFPDLCLRSLDTPGRDKTAMDWEIEASGLTALLVHIRDEYTTLPIYITENGAAFDDYVDPNGHVLDHNRVAYLQEHISAVHDAIDAVVNVRDISYGVCSTTLSGPLAILGDSASSGWTFLRAIDSRKRASTGTETRSV